MNISCRGFSRSRWNSHKVCDLDLSKRRDAGGSVKKTERGVTIEWNESVGLSGRYVFQAQLTKAEIAQLFLEAFSDVTVEDAMAVLTKVSPK